MHFCVVSHKFEFNVLMSFILFNQSVNDERNEWEKWIFLTWIDILHHPRRSSCLRLRWTSTTIFILRLLNFKQFLENHKISWELMECFGLPGDLQVSRYSPVWARLMCNYNCFIHLWMNVNECEWKWWTCNWKSNEIFN